MAEIKGARGWQGTVLKLLGADDYKLTVTGRSQVIGRYPKLSFDGGGLLRDRAPHPTMWIRMWFPDGDKVHQRGYTLVDPDSTNDTFDIEFASLHDGIASRWAENAQPGDTIEATLMGSNFTLPDPPPAGYVIVGDSASLPAVNSLLDAIGDTPAQVFLEAANEYDKELPVARDQDVVWVDRKNSGQALVETVAAAAFEATGHFGWVACDNRTTRAVAKSFREDYRIPRKSIKAQAYWVA